MSKAITQPWDTALLKTFLKYAAPVMMLGVGAAAFQLLQTTKPEPTMLRFESPAARIHSS